MTDSYERIREALAMRPTPGPWTDGGSGMTEQLTGPALVAYLRANPTSDVMRAASPLGSADPDSDEYAHDAFMWDYYQRAIDHARRVEGEGE